MLSSYGAAVVKATLGDCSGHVHVTMATVVMAAVVVSVW